ncbi:MAG TPA: 30S ribosomal protein S9 [Candidatus Krumholzibacteria bacterium]|nr:30S ribosomal protein S9 [Candidatus Krumholzibacteria bacterium]
MTAKKADAAKSARIGAVGRRKEAVVRVFVRPGTGKMTVNGKDVQDYLGRETLVFLVREPLEATESMDKFDVDARAVGGGVNGQAGALRLGLARALVKIDDRFHPMLKARGLLTRDPRMKERKKYGLAGRRKRFQFSKR